MISSMTGFGESSTEMDGVVYTVEIKSVNNRFFKAQLKLPDVVAFLEAEVENLLRKNIHRGSVNYALHLKNVSGQAMFEIDKAALNTYIQQLKDLAVGSCRIDLAGLLSLPGVILPAQPGSEQAQKMCRIVMELTEKALGQLRKMRLMEGAALTDDMLSQCSQAGEKLQLIRQRSPEVVREYEDKLKKRAQDLLSGAGIDVDPDMLAREVAFFADRCDISEELTRLEWHLKQFESCCGDGKNAGRKLDFISQEMLREANTIASKASDAMICQWVIDIKCAIDRIKEQVQNIE